MVLHVPPFYGLNTIQKNDNKDDINNRLNVSFIGVDVFTFGGKVNSGGSYLSSTQSLTVETDGSLHGRVFSYRSADRGEI